MHGWEITCCISNGWDQRIKTTLIKLIYKSVQLHHGGKDTANGLFGFGTSISWNIFMLDSLVTSLQVKDTILFFIWKIYIQNFSLGNTIPSVYVTIYKILLVFRQFQSNMILILIHVFLISIFHMVSQMLNWLFVWHVMLENRPHVLLLIILLSCMIIHVKILPYNHHWLWIINACARL